MTRMLISGVNPVHEALVAMREGRAPDRPGDAGMMKRATQAEDYDGWIADYLGGARG